MESKGPRFVFRGSNGLYMGYFTYLQMEYNYWGYNPILTFDPFTSYPGTWPNHLSHEKNPGWLGYIGDYTTQLYRDYNRPL